MKQTVSYAMVTSCMTPAAHVDVARTCKAFAKQRMVAGFLLCRCLCAAHRTAALRTSRGLFDKLSCGRDRAIQKSHPQHYIDSGTFGFTPLRTMS